MYRSMRSALAAMSTAAGVLLLAGCAQAGYSIFDREQTVDDMLPREIVEAIDLSDFDLSTSRLSASYEGVDYFLVKPSGGIRAPCIAMIDDDAGPLVVCGGSELTVGEDPRVQLVPEPAVEGHGWVAISDNLRVRDGD
jgi:hypothetical protein